jgi:DNA-binding NarL/FixJ family response regulator
MKKIKIVLADDHKIVRDGLKHLLNSAFGIEVVGEASNGRELLDLIGELNPDVVVVDISMPILNGVEATRKITELYPRVRIVVLSMHSERYFVENVFNAGAISYVLKDSAFSELIQAVESAYVKKAYFSSGISNLILRKFLSVEEAVDSEEGGEKLFQKLSGREREIIQLISEGKNTKEMAHLLHLSTKTIETHRRNIMNKINCRGVADLTRFAIKEGIIAV